MALPFLGFLAWSALGAEAANRFVQPRVELHVHLDGSMDLAALLAICKARDMELPGIGKPRSTQDVQDFMAGFKTWHRFDAVNDIIGGSVSSISQAAAHFVRFQAESGVVYTEVRYDPVRLAKSNIQNTSITEEEAVRALQEGLAAGSAEHNVVVHQILCAMRGASPQRCFETAELAAKSRSQTSGGVVGLDLAGDETDFPNRAYKTCFQHAKALGLNVTIHAGEFKESMADDVRSAIFEMGADRIGHGYAAVMEPGLFRVMRERGVHVEACPKSALLHGAWALQAIGTFHRENISFGLNTDDPATGFSNTSAAADELIVMRHLNFSAEAVRTAYGAAFRARFGSRDSTLVLV